MCMAISLLPPRQVATIAEQVQLLAEDGARAVRARGGNALLSMTLPLPQIDPLMVFARSTARLDRRLYWERPESRMAMAGMGVAWAAIADAQDRFGAISRAWQARCARLVQVGDVAPVAGPLAWAGFSFDPLRPATGLWAGFPDGAITLPQAMVMRQGDDTWLTINVVMQGEDDSALQQTLRRLRPLLDTPMGTFAARPARDHLTLEATMPLDQWSQMLTSSITTMAHDGMEKVVHTRATRVRGEHPFDTADVLARLRANYPNCYIFAFERGGRTFLGATPERLVSLRDGDIDAMSLAGSIARGTTPAEDARLGQQLLASAKDRVEHEVVRRNLLADLQDVSTNLHAPATPTLMKMANIQHLYTPVTGQARDGVGIFDLVGRLHPTPAVGGAPRVAAMELIRQQEPIDRGWYAAPVGWVDARGGGEFAVALRSGLLDGASATLYAGVGVVAASDPKKEYTESQLKLRPMLSALGSLEG